MTPRVLAMCLSSLLLLLWLPGCFPLSGPGTVTGFVGGSLSVQCQYEETYETYSKYWCKESVIRVLCDKIVETEDAERPVRKDHVTITDHPTNLTFTVTLEHLTLEDAGTYTCGINIPWSKDLGVKVVVSLTPKPTSRTSSTVVSTAKTLTTRSKVQVVRAASPAAESPTRGSSGEEVHREYRSLSLPVLLSVLALLLLLLTGTSLLAWWMIQKRVKAVKHPELSQNLRQAAEQSEPQYVNVQLHTLSLMEEPVPPRPVEIEYSTVALPEEALHYTTVVFDSHDLTSNASKVPTQGPRGEETEYSVIRKPRAGPSDPHP